MRQATRRRGPLWLAATLIAVMSLIAAACGDDDSAEPEPSVAPATEAPSSGEDAAPADDDAAPAEAEDAAPADDDDAAPAEAEDAAPADDDDAAPAETEDAAPEPVKVTLGGGAYMQTAQATLALVHGLFEANGLEVDVAEFPTGRDAMTALLGGQVDLALMAEFPVVAAALQGAEFSVIAEVSRFSDYKLQTRTDAGIESLADLPGKTVGTTVGTNVQYALETALNNAGHDSSDVDIVNLPPSGIAGALDVGDIDAGMPFDSFYIPIAELLGDRHHEIPVEGYSIHWILAASAEMSQNAEVLEAFMRSLKEAESFLEDADQAKADIINYSERVNPAYADNTFPKYMFDLQLNRDLLEVLVEEAEWLVEVQGLDGEPTEEVFLSVLDPGPLNAVAPGSSDLAG